MTVPNAVLMKHLKLLDGVVAQLGERLNGIQEVDSSILFGSTNTFPQVSAVLVFLAIIASDDPPTA